jgi:hypothetical protein
MAGGQGSDVLKGATGLNGAACGDRGDGGDSGNSETG